MPKQPRQTITVYAEDRFRRRLAKPPRQGPHIGIWWENGKTVVAILQSADMVRSELKFLDSELEHWREWPQICRHFGRQQTDDYFEVPRGRVLVRRREGHGILLHGNATSNATLKRIAKIFQIDEWTGQLDEHYLTGPESDRLFDD